MVHRAWGRREVAWTVAVALLAIAWETTMIVRWREVDPDYSSLRVIGSGTTGLLFIACGLVAVWRTSYPRMGWVLVLCGGMWMVEDITLVGTSLTFHTWWFVGEASTPGLAYAALAFPSGHLRGRLDRAVVAMAVIDGLVLGPASPITTPCGACDHRYQIVVSSWIDDSINFAHDALGLAALICVLALIGLRWLTGTRPERRMTGPFLIACAVLGLLNLPTVIGDAKPFGDVLPLSFGLAPLAFLSGLARLRLARVGVTSIMQQLDSATSLPQLREVLKRGLGDKRIAIRTWDRRDEAWHDEEGRRVADVPEPGVESTPIDARDGRPLGILNHDPALAHDPELLQAVAGAVRLALENASLHGEVTAQLARVADAADGERRRVARDLHDGAQQGLVSLMFNVAVLENRLGEDAGPEVRELLDAIQAGARRSLEDLRRLVHDLAPATLVEEGLGSAIRELGLGTPVDVEVIDRLDGRLPAAVESGVFLIAAESLANVSKHSRARAVRILLEREGDELHVAISDDGCGGADANRGSGLLGLQQRAAALGGHVTITSPAGRGTTVGAQIPLDGVGSRPLVVAD